MESSREHLEFNVVQLTLQKLQTGTPVATPMSWVAIEGKTFPSSNQVNFVVGPSLGSVGTRSASMSKRQNGWM